MLLGEHGSGLAKFGETSYFIPQGRPDREKYQCKFYFWESLESGSDGITGGISYQTNLFDDATIDALVREINLVFKEVSCEPFVMLGKLMSKLNKLN